LIEDTKFSDTLREYLRECGHSDREIGRFSLGTRLYHDLRIYGDIAEAHFEVLSEKFGVDLTNFDFQSYFPDEYPGKNKLHAMLLAFIPFSIKRRLLYTDEQYEPVTLRMIQESLRQKMW
jgi:hypothetical protein